jgi:hypothetical protein
LNYLLTDYADKYAGVVALEKLNAKRDQTRKENEGKDVKATVPAYPLFSITPSATISNGNYP